MTPGPTAEDETACNGDRSTADGIEDNHSGQHERQDDGGCATLPVALGAYEHGFRDAEEKGDREERSTGLREPKPVAEPSPIASKQSHARILRSDERKSAACPSASGVIPALFCARLLTPDLVGVPGDG